MNLSTSQFGELSHLKLLLRISDDSVGVMIAEPGPELHADYATESVKDIKRFVYDNDFLLGDYSSIDIIFTTKEVFTAPLNTAELLENMAGALLPDYDTDREILSESFGDGMVCWAVDSDLYHFLSRTFACARFHHSLALEIFSQSGLYALNETKGELHLIDINNDGKVNSLIRKSPHGSSDCAYYILAAHRPGLPIYLVTNENREDIIDIIHKIAADAKILPLSPTENQVRLRERTGAPMDVVFLTLQ